MPFGRSSLLFIAAVLLGIFPALGHAAPEYTGPSDLQLTVGESARILDLGSFFRDPDASGTLVRVSVRIGNVVKPFEIALADAQTPLTVANFLKYVNSGRAADNVFHRSLPGFVVQGGGFQWTSAGLDAVPKDPAVQNEPGISNLRGTVAMAKPGNDPNGATSEWFVNLNDNSANLDRQNGGFTVFGRVIGNGMAVLDEVAALPRYRVDDKAFTEMPLKDVTPGADVTRSNTIETNVVVVSGLSFSASTNDAFLLGVSLSGNTLRLVPSATRSGVATVTLSATDGEGAVTQGTLTVRIVDTTPRVKLTVTGASAGASVPAAGSEGLPEGSSLASFGTPAISDRKDIAARVTIAAGGSRLAGIYRESAAGVGKLVAREGQLAAAPGANFKSFTDPVLAPNGALAFVGTMQTGTAAHLQGVWTDLFGTLEPVLRQGAAIPGNARLKVKSVTSISLVNDALLAMVTLQPGGGVVAKLSDQALVRLTGRDVAVVLARTNTSFERSRIVRISALQPAARSAGQGRWHSAKSTVAKLTLADGRSVVTRLNPNGSQVRLLQTRVHDPKLRARLATVGMPAVAGTSVAVVANKSAGPGVTAANDAVLLYSRNAGPFQELVKENAAAGLPGGLRFASFSDPVANDRGELFFFGEARPAGTLRPTMSGLWVIDADGFPEVVARTGGAAVDGTGKLLANTTYGPLTSFALPDGALGGPVFIAQLAGSGVTPQTRLGLWALGSDGLVRLALRTGDEVAFPTGAKRLTGFALLNALPGSFGARRSYNATGSLAVQATFADGSQAVLRLDLP
jgi:cyclophilin family peptidyl-prolyl cis-trans isomerase